MASCRSQCGGEIEDGEAIDRVAVRGEEQRALAKSDNPELLTAGARAFDDLLDAIVRCQEANLLPADDPRVVAGPTWSLLHGSDG